MDEFRKYIRNYTQSNHGDATFTVETISGGYMSGTTPCGRRVSGIPVGEASFEVGQSVSAQRADGNWVVRGSGVSKAGG